MEATAVATKNSTDVDKKLRVVELVRRYRWHAKLDELGFAPDHVEYVSHVLQLMTACGTGQLGSHIFSCDGCDRRLIGFNRCGNRHCPGCSYDRRRQWHEQMLQWDLQCGYWHMVFTLPHESHPLIRLNLKYFYNLLFACAALTLLKTIKKHFGCRPGMIMVLHSWGQRIGFHVHVHIILTGGGLSFDEDPAQQRWIEIPRDHPALQADALSLVFQSCFLRRLKSAMRHGKLLWPETLLAGEVVGTSTTNAANLDAADIELDDVDLDDIELDDIEVIDNLVADEVEVIADDVIADSPPTKKKIPLRELTADEQDLLDVLRGKRWVVNSDPSDPAGPEGITNADGSPRKGAAGIVKYLASYVAGTAIGNGRLLSDNGRYVGYLYTDYRTGLIEREYCPGGDFVERLGLHIMPRGMQRVRYQGLFAASGREANLQRCRALIAANDQSANAASGVSGSQLDSPPQAEEESEEKTACVCRHCQGSLQVIGRLKGNETLRMKGLAAAVVSLLPAIGVEDIQRLVNQLRSGILHVWQLAEPLQEVIPTRNDFSPLELFALAGLLHEYQLPKDAAIDIELKTTSGIPPPGEGIAGGPCRVY